MEGQPAGGDSQYHYQTANFLRPVRRTTLTNSLPTSSSILTPVLPLPLQLDLQPIFLPHRTFHRAQLAQYNRLISTARNPRVQSAPLPPLLSPEHIQAVPGSRSGSSSPTVAKRSKSSSRNGHGNREGRKSSKGERSLIAEKEDTAMMAANQVEFSNPLPSRSALQHQTSSAPQQSSSVPSTPQKHARKFSFESRDPSPNAANNHSPRSAYSESNITLPSSQPQVPILGARCPYETGMSHSRRRIPYSVGDARLEKVDAGSFKNKLSKDEERALTTDMRELYDRLLPTTQKEKNRIRLVDKLEKLFNTEWPGHDIKVHMFGSSANLLFTDQSDVDICVTTDWKELESVCKIAELLGKSGMKNIVCVSTAKVPIVRIFDPELGLACDLNVNNTLALENTRMIKTYVEIDPRVRPLAMIIKHWTKRRILNDAALGGTLSSYTWICMIINYLQTRKPPILPALQQRLQAKTAPKDNVESRFADDLEALKNFGHKNDETLGELLFGFFKFYGHIFDYENLVISVRNGKQISKVEKKWHITNNRALCVEEPFNTTRNLGNTLDDISFRGLHMELRRAFDLISAGKLEECCEQYMFPKEERPNRERPAAATKKPAIIRSASQSNSISTRGRGGGHRGGRNTRHSNNNSNRRASTGPYEPNSAYYAPLHPSAGAHDHWLQLQAQAQAQAQLHNDLYQTYSVLQAQENSLRQQLLNQSQAYMQGQTPSPIYAQSQNRSRGNTITPQQANDRNRAASFEQAPLSAALRPEFFFYALNPIPYNPTPIAYPWQSSSTNPPSPAMSNATTELRRGIHRSAAPNGTTGMSGGSLRSHSQPAARSGPTPFMTSGVYPGLGIYPQVRQPSGVPNFIAADVNSESGFDTPTESLSTTPAELDPPEYLGWYKLENSPTEPSRRESMVSKIPTFGDLQEQQNRRRLSTEHMPQSFYDRLNRSSRSPSPLDHERSTSSGVPRSSTLPPSNSHQSMSTGNLRSFSNEGPLVVNGSNSSGISIPTWRDSVSGSTAYDERGERLSEAYSGMPLPRSNLPHDAEATNQKTPTASSSEPVRNMPVVVNGTSTTTHAPLLSITGPPVASTVTQNQSQSPSGQNGDTTNGKRSSPTARSRLTRQAQNGCVSPLDITSGLGERIRDDVPHLSPVYEARTPSPTTSRKLDTGFDRRTRLPNSSSNLREGPPDLTLAPLKLSSVDPAESKKASLEPKLNGHTRAVKSEGSAGTWQKITKGKKKGLSENRDLAAGQHLSENQPARESERKGG